MSRHFPSAFPFQCFLNGILQYPFHVAVPDSVLDVLGNATYHEALGTHNLPNNYRAPEKQKKNWLAFFLGVRTLPNLCITFIELDQLAELCQRRGWQKSLAPRERGWGHWSDGVVNGGIVSSGLWVNRPEGYLNSVESFVAGRHDYGHNDSSLQDV